MQLLGNSFRNVVYDLWVPVLGRKSNKNGFVKEKSKIFLDSNPQSNFFVFPGKRNFRPLCDLNKENGFLLTKTRFPESIYNSIVK